MEHQPLEYWFVGVVLLTLLGLVLRCAPPVRRMMARQLLRLGRWLLERLERVEEIDPVTEDLARAVRRERLRRDVDRLQHLLATDAWMSATRQLGNRLAYDWLVRELNGARDPQRPTPTAAAVSVSVPSRRSAESTYVASPGGHHQGTVETLDLGWRV